MLESYHISSCFQKFLILSWLRTVYYFPHYSINSHIFNISQYFQYFPQCQSHGYTVIISKSPPMPHKTRETPKIFFTNSITTKIKIHHKISKFRRHTYVCIVVCVFSYRITVLFCMCFCVFV